MPGVRPDQAGSMTTDLSPAFDAAAQATLAALLERLKHPAALSVRDLLALSKEFRELRRAYDRSQRGQRRTQEAAQDAPASSPAKDTKRTKPPIKPSEKRTAGRVKAPDGTQQRDVRE